MFRLFPLCIFLALLSPLAATDYYVSSLGNDANPGSLVMPWQTVAPINSTTFAPGDHVYFAAGETFTGGVILTAADSGTPGNPVIFGSYGAGRATLAPASNKSGFDVRDTEYLELQDLIIRGVGAAGSKDGIYLKDNGSSPRYHFWMRNCEVLKFGQNGFFVVAGTSSAGYQDVSVTASDFHDNKGCGVDFDGSFWDQTPHQHKNFYFGGCSFYNNISSGLIFVETSGALVEYCLAYNNGPSSGCIGFWCWDSDHIVFQYCESHHNHRTAGGSDGGGFDLDGATQDSLMQYNYSHDNDGGGFALYQFSWAYLSGKMINNVIRYNISQNDGKAGGYGGISMYSDGRYSGQPFPGDWIEDTEIYNNTIYTSSPASAAVEFISIYNKNIRFYNNIFYNSNMSTFIHRDWDIDDGSVVFKNNLYWRPSGAFRIDFDGVIYSSLAAWQGAGPGQQEMERSIPLGYNVDPLLVAPGTGGNVMPAPLNSLTGYKLQATSPLLEKGLNLVTRLVIGSVPGAQDFFGGNIPRGVAYDIGAHEYPLPSPTVTPSFTVSPTFTISPTHTVSPTITPTFFATPAFDSDLKVKAHLPVPNPQTGPNFSFSVKLSRPISSATLRVYSPGMRMVASAPAASPGAWSTWQALAFNLPDLGNGLYFYVIDVTGSDGQQARSSPGRLFVAR